jgi:hypothetical protein
MQAGVEVARRALEQERVEVGAVGLEATPEMEQQEHQTREAAAVGMEMALVLEEREVLVLS